MHNRPRNQEARRHYHTPVISFTSLQVRDSCIKTSCHIILQYLFCFCSKTNHKQQKTKHNIQPCHIAATRYIHATAVYSHAPLITRLALYVCVCARARTRVAGIGSCVVALVLADGTEGLRQELRPQPGRASREVRGAPSADTVRTAEESVCPCVFCYNGECLSRRPAAATELYTISGEA